MMTCDDAMKELIDLVFAEADEERAVVVQQHLVGCEACRAEERRLLRLREGMKGALAPPGAALKRRINAALPERPRRGLAGLLRRPVPAYVAAAACLVAVVLVKSMPAPPVPGNTPRPAATVVDKAPAPFAVAGSYETAVFENAPPGMGESLPTDSL